MRILPWLGNCNLDLCLGIEVAGNEFAQKLRAMLLLVGDCTRPVLEMMEPGTVAQCPGSVVELLAAVVLMPGWKTWMTGLSMR